MIQLGTRWGFGTTPPPRLAGPVADEIGRVEQSLRDGSAGVEGLDRATWTLTWLEGRPIAELDVDGPDGRPVVVTTDTTGAPVIESEVDDSW